MLPNYPGFDWGKVRALPEVAAVSEFPVTFGFALSCCPDAGTGFPPIGDEYGRTIERPYLLAGRMFDPARVDEVLVTPLFAAAYHKRVGDTVTLHLASVEQANEQYDGTTGPPRGPVVKARITGVGRSPWLSIGSDSPGQKGAVQASPALYARYRANILGNSGQNYINALIRLKGGTAAIPAFRADLARVTGRSDIDVWNNRENFGKAVERITRYEAACLFAFALAALVAALFLVGQSVARYTSATVADLQVLQAVGMTPRQAVASATAAPLLAAAAGSTLGVAAALVASRWMPIGLPSYYEPHPGMRADWSDLGPGWLPGPVLVAAGSAAAAAPALTAPTGGPTAAGAAWRWPPPPRPGRGAPVWWAPGSRSNRAGAGPRCRSGPPCWAPWRASWVCWPPSPSRPGCPTPPPTRRGSARPSSWRPSSA